MRLRPFFFSLVVFLLSAPPSFALCIQTPTNGFADDGIIKALNEICASLTGTGSTAVAPVKSAAAESGHVLKAAAGSLIGFSVTTGAAAGYILVLDSATVPSDGAVTPVKCYQVPAASTLAAGYSTPIAFATGISLSFSTTGCFTKTASATAFISGEVR